MVVNSGLLALGNENDLVGENCRRLQRKTRAGISRNGQIEDELNPTSQLPYISFQIFLRMHNQPYAKLPNSTTGSIWVVLATDNRTGMSKSLTNWNGYWIGCDKSIWVFKLLNFWFSRLFSLSLRKTITIGRDWNFVLIKTLVAETEPNLPFLSKLVSSYYTTALPPFFPTPWLRPLRQLRGSFHL